MVEYEGVDLPRYVPLFEILGAHPACERLAEALLRCVSELRECRGHLASQLLIEVEETLWVWPAEVEVVELDQPPKLRNRFRVIVDAEIDSDIEAAAVRSSFTPDADAR